MSLIRWQPWRELELLRQQMDQVFNELSRNESELGLPLGGRETTWIPAIELKETDTELILKAQLPGVSADDLDVQVMQEAISIAGEHHDEKRTEEKGLLRSEFRYGRFQRLIPLPVPVQNEQVKAEFNHGVLMLTLPKMTATPRKVVKVNLGLQEKAREAVTQQRQQNEHLQETAHSRSVEMGTPADIQEKTREMTAEQRQQTEHLQASLHNRSAENVKQPS